MSFKPTLPAKKGYVEVEVDGIRKYKNAKTNKLLSEEIEKENAIQKPTQEERIAALESAMLTMMMTMGV